MMASESYRTLTKKLMDAADEVCEGRLVLCHERGYSGHTVPFFGLAVLEQLSGIRTGVEDPFQPILAGLGAGLPLQPHQDALLKQVEPLLKKL